MTIDLREAIENVDRYFEKSGLMTESWPVVMEAARSLLPKTKMVEVWRVEYAWEHAGEQAPVIAQYTSHELAQSHARALGSAASCIRVTGPHQQEVPA